jgi:type II secretory pathway predicted ATPase ExeA
MDILQYFYLNEHPFRIGPDPRSLYLSEQVKEAIAKCEYMARERIGPIYIYGPIGAGKTSLLRRLYERLGQDDKYNLALLISPNVKSSNAFLRMMMEAYVWRRALIRGRARNHREFRLTLGETIGAVGLTLRDPGRKLGETGLRSSAPAHAL